MMMTGVQNQHKLANLPFALAWPPVSRRGLDRAAGTGRDVFCQALFGQAKSACVPRAWSAARVLPLRPRESLREFRKGVQQAGKANWAGPKGRVRTVPLHASGCSYLVHASTVRCRCHR